jgi:hypothetical protein
MKKSTLALSVAAALGGLGFVTSASAITTAVVPPAQIAAAVDTSYPALVPQAATLKLNGDGIGHQLIVPYFTTQGNNATLLEITNHDLLRGKLVKVRFRGAANSDDLFDFTLMLSPGDVWTASVSKDATSGKSRLVTADKSCVLPAYVSAAGGNEFSTARTDPALTGDAAAAQTREGYVEIITMADIPKSYTDIPDQATDGQYDAPGADAARAGTLYGTIKHANGVAACDANVLEAKLGTDANDAALLQRGLMPPTGLISGDWIIINQANTAAWSGAATALRAQFNGVNAAASLVFWPQKFGTPNTAGTAKNGIGLATGTYTADPLLLSSGTTPAVVAPQYYDLPDLSTTYASSPNAYDQARVTTFRLAVKTLAHQILTVSGIAAVTDVVFSQPTRRYHVAMNYTAGTATDNDFTTTGTSAAAVYQPLTTGDYYKTTNTDPIGRQVCVVNVNAPGVQGVFNQEETSPTVGGTNFVISPNVPGAAAVLQLCGETSVVSINQGGIAAPSAALSGSVARTDVTFNAGYEAGWATWDLTAAGANVDGLPVIANAFIRARNGAVNYGFAWPAKVTRL